MKKSKINKIVIFTQPVGGARGGLIRNWEKIRNPKSEIILISTF
jgi:hypothetical protein